MSVINLLDPSTMPHWAWREPYPAALLEGVMAALREHGEAPNEETAQEVRALLGVGVMQREHVANQDGPGQLFRATLLSADYCDALVEFSRGLRYKVNACEEEEFQIPEVVLGQEAPELYEALFHGIVSRHLVALFFAAFGRYPRSVASIQLARYSDENTAGGNWHYDDDSDLTAVVALNNPWDFDGGGTSFYNPFRDETAYLPPLLKGHALLFRGRWQLHRGEPVTRGERNLLVIWTKLESAE